jgi:DNA polymerase III epsilon subunit family exonuclease
MEKHALEKLSARNRYILAVVVLSLLMAGPFVAVAIFAWAEGTVEHRAIFAHYFQQLMPLGALLTLLALWIGFAVLNRLFRAYVTGMAATAERLAVMLTSNRDLRLDIQGPPELQAVIGAMNRLADQRDHRINEVEARVVAQRSMYEALCERSAGSSILDHSLQQLAYAAFDTETTGLQPSNGDEIIQIGALHVTDGHLEADHAFEALIDPLRPISPESLKIHGISDAAVHGQPTITQVLPEFYDFCEGRVLLGHNVAFDMRFLQLKEQSTRVVFRQPVLDTLLLSAVAYPNQPHHSLESSMALLGVTIEHRHSAYSDAVATAQVFLKLVPLLEERGIITLRQAIEASAKTPYARLAY